MSNNNSQPMGLEEKLVLIPFVISILLTLVAFVVKFVNPDSAMVWTSLSYYAYAWVCCITVSMCVRRDKHLQISLFENVFPDSVNKILAVITHIIEFLVVLGIFIASFILLKGALTEGLMDAKIPQIPLALGYFAPVLGFGMALVRFVLRVVKGGDKA